MKAISFLSLLFILSSCSHFTGEDNKFDTLKYQISQVSNEKTGYTKGNGHIKLEFEDYEVLKNKLEIKIKNEVLSELNSSKMRKQLPKGGQLWVRIFRPTVDTGNTKNFTYILFINGKEVKRQEGGSYFKGAETVPQTPTYSGLDGNLWTNLDVVEIDNEFKPEDKVTLYVIDKIISGRDEFELSFKKPNK